MTPLSRPALLAVCLLTVATMLPVTAVVPVLKPLILDRYGVGEFATSTFMSLNMVGALVAAPLAGRLSDRRGWTLSLLASAALADALLWALIARLPSYPVLALLRTAEGAAHIVVLSMLLTIVSRTSDVEGRRARMAAAGAAIVLGVALGAPLGGIVGRSDASAPLRAGAWLMAAVAVGAWLLLPRVRSAPAPVEDRARLWHVPAALRLPYVFSFVDRFSVGVFVVAFPLFAGTSLGLGPAPTGLLIGAFMLPFALLNWPMGRLGERRGAWPLVLGGSVVYGLLFAAIPWLGVGALLPVMLGCGITSAVMFGPTLVLVLQRSAPDARARAVGGFNAAGSLGFLIGPLAAGLLLEGLTGAAAMTDLAAQRVVFAFGAASQFAAVAVAAVSLRRA